MQLNPKSKAIIDQLNDSKSIPAKSVTIGLFDEITKDVLKILIENYDILNALSGDSRVEKLIALYDKVIENKKIDATKQEKQTQSQPIQNDTIKLNTFNKWYIHNIKCHSVRGIDLYGKTFEFSFEGKSNLIFGPNGSGKSSLLSAIIWAFAGITVTDTTDEEQETNIYQKTTGIKKGGTICNWPLIATLPESDVTKNLKPDSWVIIELKSKDNMQSLYVKRSLEKGMEVGNNENDLNICKSLENYGISPLDIQVALVAPTILSRNTLDNAVDIIKILSMILGYDNLDDIGKLAENIGRNRTAYANKNDTTVTQNWKTLEDKVAHLLDPLPEKSNLREKLKLNNRPTIAELAEKQILVQSEIDAANEIIATILGITGDEKAKEGIADKLVAAIEFLEKEFNILFPSFSKIKYDKNECNDKAIENIEDEFSKFIENAKERITNRIKWWKREKEEGSKLSLKLLAAQDYNPESMACPVCEQSIKNLPLKDELASLKSADQELQRKLKDFFNDLSEELKKIIPQNIQDIGTKLPSDRVSEDWKEIKNTLDKRLTKIVEKYDSPISDACKAITNIPIDALVFFNDTDEDLIQASELFIKAVNISSKAIEILKWGITQFDDVKGIIENIIKISKTNSDTLLSELSKNKTKALEIPPLKTIKMLLEDIVKLREIIVILERKSVLLENLKAPIDELKKLSKYALEQTETVFSEIKDIAHRNWKLLYEESPTGLSLEKLVLERGKTIEPLLSKQNYEVAGKYFANAGLQRAIALSFLCALLEKNNKKEGLAFAIFDDPILSLDEDHREKWADDILAPLIEKELQTILSTHQGQFKKNCSSIFSNTIEFNPRDRKQPISWRPGDALSRAEEILKKDHAVVPNMLRKYCEQVLITLQAYSADDFYNPESYSKSLARYKALTKPNPLASPQRDQIISALKNDKIDRVLDPGSHSLTEDDITKPMTQDCLNHLKSHVDRIFKAEIERLKQSRKRKLNGKIIPIVLAQKNNHIFNEALRMKCIGRAAARPESWVVESSDNEASSIIQNFTCTHVTSDTLDPVARYGQCVLLANNDIIADGDLIVGQSVNEENYLRRVAFNNGDAFLYSTNPIKTYQPLQIDKNSLSVNKVIGVLYNPCRKCIHDSSKTDEWCSCSQGIDLSYFATMKMIVVEGDSMEPIARKGQKVLVKDGQTPNVCDIESGGLAVIETDDKDIGNEIKRVYPDKDNWILVSVNPLVSYKPDVVPVEKIKKIWPLCGVIFESVYEE